MTRAQSTYHFSSYVTIGISLCLFIVLQSCDPSRIYEKNQDIPHAEWHYADTLHFDVHISDTLPKNIYLIARHSFYFEWRNMWTTLHIQQPDQSIIEKDINIPLSQPDGAWFGDCSGDICLTYFPMNDYIHYTFPEPGMYRFSLIQNMRENPLPKILSMGIRIERAYMRQ